MNVNDRLYPYVENMLDWTAKRQQSISANLANFDTPNYAARDVSFSDHLQMLGLETTSSDHIAPNTSGAGMRVYEVGTRVKDNGNSVDLDREMTEQTKNGLQYVTLIQYLNQKFKTLRTAITEGGKS